MREYHEVKDSFKEPESQVEEIANQVFPEFDLTYNNNEFFSILSIRKKTETLR